MKKMSAQELREVFLNFFEERGHEVVPSSSLIPADPTSLFTSAGMQQFIPYLSGESEPPYKRACSVQKCVRVNDVDEVGDRTHHTFFEMMGNWSFGDYFKEKAIEYALEFLLDELKMDKDRLWVSIFEGEEGVPRDDEAERLWTERGIPAERIFEYDRTDNFWGPVGKTGPCGPCTEIFYRVDEPCGPDCHPNCSCGALVEVWNLVFMELDKKGDGFEPLKQQNVDTGIGFERLLALLQEKGSAYGTDLFEPIVKEMEERTGESYEENKVRFRVSADHLRAAVFITADRVRPSNTDRGYVLRMLLRRLFRHLSQLGFDGKSYPELVRVVVETYRDAYPELAEKEDEIAEVVQTEEAKFGRTLERGLKRFRKLLKKERDVIEGEEAFDLYQSYGFPLELTVELAGEEGLEVDRAGYEAARESHRERSRAGAEKKFGGGGELSPPLHTATHLLQAALRAVLGDHVRQNGSDITEERLRFDFTHPDPLTEAEVSEIERWVNGKIGEDLPVSRKRMSYEEAVESGALAFFKERYPKEVFVYNIGGGEPVSREVCGGPHVERTGELGRFEIVSEESVGAGLRRIKAVLKE